MDSLSNATNEQIRQSFKKIHALAFAVLNCLKSRYQIISNNFKCSENNNTKLMNDNLFEMKDHSNGNAFSNWAIGNFFSIFIILLQFN